MLADHQQSSLSLSRTQCCQIVTELRERDRESNIIELDKEAPPLIDS